MLLGRDPSLQLQAVVRTQEGEVPDSRGDGAGKPLEAEIHSNHSPLVSLTAAAVAGALVRVCRCSVGCHCGALQQQKMEEASDAEERHVC